jgi:hypothetical protein
MIVGLSIDVREREDSHKRAFLVEIENGMDGMAATFECRDIKVVDATPCSSDGEAL